MTADNAHTPLLHVVLHEPEIPNNTGNIGRTCIATACALHIVHPLGFSTDQRALRRAGLDYWPRLDPTEHRSWLHYQTAHPAARRWYFTTKGARPVWDADFRPGDHLVFGKETAGLPDHIINDNPDTTLVFPMLERERSLNLATAVCAAIYEGLRQLRARGTLSLTTNARITPLCRTDTNP